MNFTATIAGVEEQLREWQGPNGTTCFIQGGFLDGSLWSVGCKPENASKRQAEMRSLIGIAGEYEAEPGGEYQGAKKWKLKSWPGKPQPGGGGFGGGGGKAPYKERYRDSEQGAKEERDAIARSVALQQAVLLRTQHITPGDVVSPEFVLAAAGPFYEWLVKNNKPVSQAFDPGPQRATPASPNQVQAQSQQAQRTLMPEAPKSTGGTPACPQCGKTDSVIPSKFHDAPPWYCFPRREGCGAKFGRNASSDVPSIQVGPTPAGSKSVAVKASEAISEAVKKASLSDLASHRTRIKDRFEEGAINQQEMAELEIELSTAQDAIASGVSYSEWFNRKLAEIQAMEAEFTHPTMAEQVDRF